MGQIKKEEYEAELIKLRIEHNNLLHNIQEVEKFNRNKSEFLANMSHELRTPMHAILSFSKMSLKKLGVIERDRLMNNLEIIYDNGQRLLHTLNDILDISKLEAQSMEFDFEKGNLVLEVTAIIRELQSLLLDKGLTYKMRALETKGVAEFDTYRIGQVIQNILSNAIKFTPTEGEIEILISEKKSQPDFIRVSISDQGHGIPEDELESIFDKYEQSSRKSSHIGGTGLGLSISQQIIQSHGGKIWANNNLHVGSSFHFIIPKTQNPNQLISKKRQVYYD
jgi:signal transduction histidine kinase